MSEHKNPVDGLIEFVGELTKLYKLPGIVINAKDALKEYREALQIMEKESNSKWKECLEWFWLHDECHECFGMSYDGAPGTMTDVGAEELDDIYRHAWKQFYKLSGDIKNQLDKED